MAAGRSIAGQDLGACADIVGLVRSGEWVSTICRLLPAARLRRRDTPSGLVEAVRNPAVSGVIYEAAAWPELPSDELADVFATFRPAHPILILLEKRRERAWDEIEHLAGLGLDIHVVLASDGNKPWRQLRDGVLGKAADGPIVRALSPVLSDLDRPVIPAVLALGRRSLSAGDLAFNCGLKEETMRRHLRDAGRPRATCLRGIACGLHLLWLFEVRPDAKVRDAEAMFGFEQYKRCDAFLARHTTRTLRQNRDAGGFPRLLSATVTMLRCHRHSLDL